MSYSYLDGVPFGTMLEMDMGSGVVFDLTAVGVELGEGPVADELRSLGLPAVPDWRRGAKASVRCFTSAAPLPWWTDRAGVDRRLCSKDGVSAYPHVGRVARPWRTIVDMTPEEIADLVHLRRARDLIDRDYAQPLDVPAMARPRSCHRPTSRASSAPPTARRPTPIS